MINIFINGVINFIFHLVDIFLGSIDTFINNNFPVISDALNAINSLFSYVLGFIGYCVDASGLTPISIALITSYLAFSLIGTFVTRVVKVVLKWWDKLI